MSFQKATQLGARRYLVGRPAYAYASADAVVTYRLDMVETVKSSGKSFTRPDAFNLQSFANRSFCAFQSDAEYSKIVWRFAPEAAEHAGGHLFHPNQTTESEPDGPLIVRFEASGLAMACYTLSNRGHDFRLLQDFMGHRDPRHTTRYTRTVSRRFEGMWV